MSRFQLFRSKLGLTIVGLLFLTSCSTVTIKNTPSSIQTDKNIGNYYVTSYEVSLENSLENSENSEKLKLYKEAFTKRLAERNKKRKSSIDIKAKILITKFKIKGQFARINRMLGGKDSVQASVELINSKGKVFRRYKSEIESGILPKENHVYRLSSSAILSEVFGEEEQ